MQSELHEDFHFQSFSLFPVARILAEHLLVLWNHKFAKSYPNLVREATCLLLFLQGTVTNQVLVIPFNFISVLNGEVE